MYFLYFHNHLHCRFWLKAPKLWMSTCGFTFVSSAQKCTHTDSWFGYFFWAHSEQMHTKWSMMWSTASHWKFPVCVILILASACSIFANSRNEQTHFASNHICTLCSKSIQIRANASTRTPWWNINVHQLVLHAWVSRLIPPTLTTLSASLWGSQNSSVWKE